VRSVLLVNVFDLERASAARIGTIIAGRCLIDIPPHTLKGKDIPAKLLLDLRTLHQAVFATSLETNTSTKEKNLGWD
jgi:hypothetical protein